MGKRKEIESLEKEVKKLRTALASLQRDESSEESNSEEITAANQQENNSSDEEKENKENKKESSNENIKDSNNENEEIPLSAELELALGDDPTNNIDQKFHLHSSVAKRWSYWSVNGLKNEEKEELLKNYPCLKEIKIPELNLEIAAKSQENCLKRDNHIKGRQKITASVLTILGSLMSSILNEEESLDKMQTIESLNDAAKLLNHLIFEQTESRKAFLLPGIEKKYKKVLEAAVTGEFLFSKDLSEKIKAQNIVEKIGHDIRPQRSTPLHVNSNLNFRGPSTRGRGHWQAGFSSNQSGRGRQRLFFRDKNQPINTRFQNQPPRSNLRNHRYGK